MSDENDVQPDEFMVTWREIQVFCSDARTEREGLRQTCQALGMACTELHQQYDQERLAGSVSPEQARERRDMLQQAKRLQGLAWAITDALQRYPLGG